MSRENPLFRLYFRVFLGLDARVGPSPASARRETSRLVVHITRLLAERLRERLSGGIGTITKPYGGKLRIVLAVLHQRPREEQKAVVVDYSLQVPTGRGVVLSYPIHPSRAAILHAGLDKCTQPTTRAGVDG